MTKLIVPNIINISSFNNELKFSELSLLIKCFSVGEKKYFFKYGLKECGFVLKVIKNSVFVKSFFMEFFLRCNKKWLASKGFYWFFFQRGHIFFLSDYIIFKDFYSFFFFYVLVYQRDVFFIFLKTNNLIFFIFKDLNLLMLPVFILFEKFIKFDKLNKSQTLGKNFIQKLDSLVLKNYSIFTVWFYFLSVLRNFYVYFIFKFLLFYFCQKKIFYGYFVSSNEKKTCF